MVKQKAEFKMSNITFAIISKDYFPGGDGNSMKVES